MTSGLPPFPTYASSSRLCCLDSNHQPPQCQHGLPPEVLLTYQALTATRAVAKIFVRRDMSAKAAPSVSE